MAAPGVATWELGPRFHAEAPEQEAAPHPNPLPIEVQPMGRGDCLPSSAGPAPRGGVAKRSHKTSRVLAAKRPGPSWRSHAAHGRRPAPEARLSARTTSQHPRAWRPAPRGGVASRCQRRHKSWPPKAAWAQGAPARAPAVNWLKERRKQRPHPLVSPLKETRRSCLRACSRYKAACTPQPYRRRVAPAPCTAT
jgi:hypothetical protein